MHEVLISPANIWSEAVWTDVISNNLIKNSGWSVLGAYIYIEKEH